MTAITGYALGRRGHPVAGVMAGALVVAAILYGIASLRPPRARAWATVADYWPLAVAALWVGHPPSTRRHLSPALDAAVLGLAATLLVWITLIRPTIVKLNLNVYGRDLILLDWATDIATVAIATLLILTWHANRSALLLGGAIVALLASDTLQGLDLLNGNTRETSVDGGFLLFCALAGLAASTRRWST